MPLASNRASPGRSAPLCTGPRASSCSSRGAEPAPQFNRSLTYRSSRFRHRAEHLSYRRRKDRRLDSGGLQMGGGVPGSQNFLASWHRPMY